MIAKFNTVYAGHVDIHDRGQDGTPANERRFSNAHLASGSLSRPGAHQPFEANGDARGDHAGTISACRRGGDAALPALTEPSCHA